MSGLCWMTVLLACSLFTGTSLALDVEFLQDIVQGIKDKYMEYKQFSVAVNVPTGTRGAAAAFQGAASDTVIDKLKQEKLFIDTNMVAAMPKKEGSDVLHAEGRVLDNIGGLVKESANKILIFYTYNSPCGDKCTDTKHPYNIIKKINKLNGEWTDKAFVFTKVYDEYISSSITELSKTQFGRNIFRCSLRGTVMCSACFKIAASKDYIVSDDCLSN